MSYAFSLLAIGMILTILFIPIVHQLLAVPSTEGSYPSDFEPFTPTWHFFQQFLEAFGTFSPLNGYKGMPGIFLAFILLGCLSNWRNPLRRRVTIWLTLWWLLPFFTVPLMLAIAPWSMAQARFYMFALPAYLLLGLYGMVAFVELIFALVKAIAPSNRTVINIRRFFVYSSLAILVLAIAVPRTIRLISDLRHLEADQAWTSVAAYLRTEVGNGDIILCEAFGLPGGDDDRCRWHLKEVEKSTNVRLPIQSLSSISNFRNAEGLRDTLQGKGRVWFVLYFREAPSYQIKWGENAPGLTVTQFGDTRVIRVDSGDHLIGNLIDCGRWLIEHLPDAPYQFRRSLDLSQLYALSGDTDTANSYLEKAIHAQQRSNDPNWIKELRTVAAIVRFYAPANPVPQYPRNVNFDNRVRLYGYSLEPDLLHQSAQPSEVKMTFYWQVLALVEKDYSVFVHLEDAEGNTVSQFDFRPFDDILPTSQWPAGTQVREARQFPIPGELPAGEYTFAIGLYLPDNMNRLGIVNDSSGEGATRLGTLVVDRP